MPKDILYNFEFNGFEGVEARLDKIINKSAEILTSQQKLKETNKEATESYEEQTELLEEFKKLKGDISKLSEDDQQQLKAIEKERKSSLKTMVETSVQIKEQKEHKKGLVKQYETEISLSQALNSAQEKSDSILAEAYNHQIDLNKARKKYQTIGTALAVEEKKLQKQHEEGLITQKELQEGTYKLRGAFETLKEGYQEVMDAQGRIKAEMANWTLPTKDVDELNEKYQRLHGSFASVESELGGGKKAFEKLTSEIDATTDALGQQDAKLTNVARMLFETTQALADGSGEFSTYEDRAKGATQGILETKKQIKALDKTTADYTSQLKKLKKQQQTFEKIRNESIKNAKELKRVEEQVASQIENNAIGFSKAAESIGQAGTIMSNIGGTIGELGGAFGGIADMAGQLPGTFKEINSTMDGSSATIAKLSAGFMMAFQAGMMLYQVFDNLIKGQEEAIINAGKEAQQQQELVSQYNESNKSYEARLNLIKELGDSYSPELSNKLRSVAGNTEEFEKALKEANEEMKRTRELGAAKEFEVSLTGGGLLGWFNKLGTVAIPAFTEAVGKAHVAVQDLSAMSTELMTAYKDSMSDMGSYIDAQTSKVANLRISIASAQGNEAKVRQLKLEALKQEKELLIENTEEKLRQLRLQQAEANILNAQIKQQEFHLRSMFTTLSEDNLSGYTVKMADAIRRMFPELGKNWEKLDKAFEAYVDNVIDKSKNAEEAINTIWQRIADEDNDSLTKTARDVRWSIIDKNVTTYIRSIMEIKPAVETATSVQIQYADSIDNLEAKLNKIAPAYNKVIELTKQLWSVQDANKNKSTIADDMIPQPDEVESALTGVDVKLQKYIDKWNTQYGDASINYLQQKLNFATQRLEEVPEGLVELYETKITYLQELIAGRFAEIGNDANKLETEITRITSLNATLSEAGTDEANAQIEANNLVITALQDRFDLLTSLTQQTIQSGEQLIEQALSTQQNLLDSNLTPIEKQLVDFQRNIDKAISEGASDSQVKTLRDQKTELSKILKENEKITREQESQRKQQEEILRLEKETKENAIEHAKTLHDYWVGESITKAKENISDLGNSLAETLFDAGLELENLKQEYEGFPEIIANEEIKFHKKIHQELQEFHKERVNEAKELAKELTEEYQEFHQQVLDMKREISDLEKEIYDNRKSAQDDINEYILKSEMNEGELRSYERAQQIADEYEDYRNAGLEQVDLQKWLSAKRQEVRDDENITLKNAFNEYLKTMLLETEAKLSIFGTKAEQLQESLDLKKQALTEKQSQLEKIKIAAEQANNAVNNLLTMGTSGQEQILKEYMENSRKADQSFEEWMTEKLGSKEKYETWLNDSNEASKKTYRERWEADTKSLTERNEQLVKSNPFLKGLEAVSDAIDERVRLHEDMQSDIEAIEGEIAEDAEINANAYKDSWVDALSSIKTEMENLRDEANKPIIDSAVGEAVSGAQEESVSGIKDKKPEDIGKDLSEQINKGIKDNKEEVKRAVSEGIVDPIAVLLECHSPPKEGKLSNIIEWGTELTQLFSEGLKDGSEYITEAVDDISSVFHSRFIRNLETNLEERIEVYDKMIRAATGTTTTINNTITLTAMDAYDTVIDYLEDDELSHPHHGGIYGLAGEFNYRREGSVAAKMLQAWSDTCNLLYEYMANTFYKIHETAIQECKDLSSKMSEAFDGIYEDGFDIGAEFVSGIIAGMKSELAPLRQTANQVALAMIPNTKNTGGGSNSDNKMADFMNDAKEWVVNNGMNETGCATCGGGDLSDSYNGVYSTLTPSAMMEYGSELTNAYAEGITSNKDKANEAAHMIANEIARPLETHSPPSEGKLKDIDNWGYDLINEYALGMRVGQTQIDNVVNEITNRVGNLENIDLTDAGQAIMQSMWKGLDSATPTSFEGYGVPGATDEITSLQGMLTKLMSGEGVETEYIELQEFYKKKSTEFESLDTAAGLIRNKGRLDTLKNTAENLLNPDALEERVDAFYDWFNRGLIPKDLGEIDYIMLKQELQDHPEWKTYYWLQQKLKEQYPELYDKAVKEGLIEPVDIKKEKSNLTGQLVGRWQTGNLHKQKHVTDHKELDVSEGQDTFNQWLQREFTEWNEDHGKYEDAGLVDWYEAREEFLNGWQEGRLSELVTRYLDYLKGSESEETEIEKGFSGSVKEWQDKYSDTRLGKSFTGDIGETVANSKWTRLAPYEALIGLLADYAGNYSNESIMEWSEGNLENSGKYSLATLLGFEPGYSVARGWSGATNLEGKQLVDTDNIVEHEIQKNIEMIEDKLTELGVDNPQAMKTLMALMSGGHQYGLKGITDDKGAQIDQWFGDMKNTGVYGENLGHIQLATSKAVKELIAQGLIERETGANIIKNIIPESVKIPETILGDMDFNQVEAILKSPWGKGLDRQTVGRRWFNVDRDAKQGRGKDQELYDYLTKSYQPRGIQGYNPNIYIPELGGGIEHSQPIKIGNTLYYPMEGEYMPLGEGVMPQAPAPEPVGSTISGTGSGNVIYNNFTINIESINGVDDLEKTFIDILYEADTGYDG